jgi:hypothetical protein
MLNVIMLSVLMLNVVAPAGVNLPSFYKVYSLAILQIIFSLKHGVLATKISVYKIFSMAFNFVKMKTKVLAGLGVY